MKRRRRIPTRSRIAKGAAVWLAIAVILAPLLWMLDTSFMTQSETLSIPPHVIPQHPTLDNYHAFIDPEHFGGQAADASAALGRALVNSAVVSVAVAAICVLLGSCAGYALARFRFRGSYLLLVFYVITRLVPPVALMIPIFLMMRKLGLLNNLGSLILIDCGIALPMVVWMLRSYFLTLPRELEEAAWIDGCSRPRAALQVMLPLAVPGLVAAGVFSFLTAWSDFVYPAVLLRDESVQTVPLLLARFASGVFVERGIMTAAGIVSLLPPILFALIFQRYLVQGLAAGASKG